MAKYIGNIRKMRVDTDNLNKALYQLPVGDGYIDVNAIIGNKVSVAFEGEINCVHCQRKTRKSFNQGYCYPCLTSLAQCDSCIIKPELCHFAAGTCREPAWGEANCFNDHIVYLANTGTLKVGITRHVSDGVSSRWLDQGATQAIAVLRVENRLMSGLVETAFKSHVADKTNWRTMLKGCPEHIDLVECKQTLLQKVMPELDNIRQQHGLQAVAEVQLDPVSIEYPVIRYPDKIRSINLDKDADFEGILEGVKGQYWLMDGGRVINMRKYAGYKLSIEIH